MDQQAQQQIVIRLLRTVCVIAVFVGCILASQTLIATLAAMSATSNLPHGMNVQFKGAFGDLTIWAIIAQLVTVAWGLALFAFARPIASLIVED